MMKNNLISFRVGMPMFDILNRLEEIEGNYELHQRYIFDNDTKDLIGTEVWSVIVRLLNDNLLIIQFNEDQEVEFTTELKGTEFSGMLASES